MAKTFKDLLENLIITNVTMGGIHNPAQPLTTQTDDATGVETHTLMAVSEIEHMTKFAQQISGAFQSTMPNLLAKMEIELNKFGYTLGELDDTPDFDEDTEDFVIFKKAGNEMVENVYITVEYEKMASGVQMDIRPDSNLSLRVQMTVNKVTPDEMAEILHSDDDLQN